MHRRAVFAAAAIPRRSAVRAAERSAIFRGALTTALGATLRASLREDELFVEEGPGLGRGHDERSTTFDTLVVRISKLVHGSTRWVFEGEGKRS